MSHTVSKGQVYSYGLTTDSNDLVLSGGTMIIESGGTAASTTISAGGFLTIDSGGLENDNTVNLGTLNGSGGVLSNTVSNGGTLGAVGSDGFLSVLGTITNNKTIVASGSGVDGWAETYLSGTVANSGGTIEAVATAAGSLAFVDLAGAVTNGNIVASGNGTVDIDGATVTSATLKTTGSGEIGVFSYGSATIDGGTVSSATTISDDGTLTVSGATLAASDMLKVSDGGVLTLSGDTFAAHDQVLATYGGLAVVNGGATFQSGVIVEASDDGYVNLSGSIANSGTIVASGSTSLSGTATINGKGGTLVNSGAIEALATNSGSASLAVSSASVTNSGTMEASASNYGQATLSISGATVVNSNTMKVLANDEGFATANLSATTLDNSGTIEASAGLDAGAYLNISGGTISNIRTIEATAGSGSFVDVIVSGVALVNSGTISMSATPNPNFDNGSLIFSAAVTNAGSITLTNGYLNFLHDVNNSGGRITASTSELHVENSYISGGMLQTVGSNSYIDGDGGIESATLLSRTQVVARGGGQIYLDSDTFAAGDRLIAVESAGLTISGSANFSAGTLVEAGASGGSAGSVTISAPIANAGTIEAISGGTVSANAGVGAVTNSGAGTIEAVEAANTDAAVTVSGGTFSNAGTVAALATNSNGDSTESVMFNINSAVSNAGTIEASATADNKAFVEVFGGGTITNSNAVKAVDSGGTESAFAEVELSATGALVNSGTMEASATAGGTAYVNLSGGTVTNTKTIEGLAIAAFAGVNIAASGAVVNSGTISASAGGDGYVNIGISGGSITNSGTIEASISSYAIFMSFSASGSIVNDHAIVASSLAPDGDVDFFMSAGANISNSGTIDLVTINDGDIDGANGQGIYAGGNFVNAGGIVLSAGNQGYAALNISAGGSASNNSGKTIEAVANNGDTYLYITATTISNAGTLEALATGLGETEVYLSGNVANSGGFLIASAGSGAQAIVNLDGVVVSGGTLETSGAGFAAIATSGGGSGGTIVNATVASNALVGGLFGGDLTVSGGTVDKGATVLASAGNVDISGTITNLGTLSAVAGGQIDITTGASVVGSGGIAIGRNGDVVIDGTTSEGIAIQSGASSAEIVLLDDAASTSAYGGYISGFGGAGGEDTSQFIDLNLIVSAAGIKVTYDPNATHPTSSGTLIVSSGATEVAAINLVGNYTYATFTTGADGAGRLEIFDPSGPTPGKNNPALFGQYIAASFVSAAGAAVPSGGEAQNTQSLVLTPSHS